jgi:hypothetical protein
MVRQRAAKSNIGLELAIDKNQRLVPPEGRFHVLNRWYRNQHRARKNSEGAL